MAGLIRRVAIPILSIMQCDRNSAVSIRAGDTVYLPAKGLAYDSPEMCAMNLSTCPANTSICARKGCGPNGLACATGQGRAVHRLGAEHVGRSFFSTSDGNGGIPPHS